MDIEEAIKTVVEKHEELTLNQKFVVAMAGVIAGFAATAFTERRLRNHFKTRNETDKYIEVDPIDY